MAKTVISAAGLETAEYMLGLSGARKRLYVGSFARNVQISNHLKINEKKALIEEVVSGRSRAIASKPLVASA